MSISKYSLPTYPSYYTDEDVMSSEYDAYSTTPVKVYIKVEEDYIMSSKDDYYLEYPIFVKILDIYIAEDAIINGYHYSKGDRFPSTNNYHLSSGGPWGLFKNHDWNGDIMVSKL